MIFLYFAVLSIALFSIGIAGVLSSKHFIIMMLSIELIFAASILLALTFFYYVASGNIVLLAISIFAIASAEVLAIVAFYRYMVKGEISLDVTNLSKLKN